MKKNFLILALLLVASIVWAQPALLPPRGFAALVEAPTNSTTFPIIVWDAESQREVLGTPVQFMIEASGAEPLAYQWYFKNTNNVISKISGATSSNYATVIASNNVGGYYNIVTNSFGSVTSSIAPLAVAPPTVTIRLSWNYTNAAKIHHYELLSTPALGSGFTLLTNSGLGTNMAFVYYKTNLSGFLSSNRFYRVKGILLSTNIPSVQLAWNYDPLQRTNIAGFYIYYGSDGSRVYTNKTLIGNTLSGQINGLSKGRTYYFAAVAVNALGVESDFSDEVSYATPLTEPSTNSVGVQIKLVLEK